MIKSKILRKKDYPVLSDWATVVTSVLERWTREAERLKDAVRLALKTEGRTKMWKPLNPERTREALQEEHGLLTPRSEPHDTDSELLTSSSAKQSVCVVVSP